MAVPFLSPVCLNFFQPAKKFLWFYYNSLAHKCKQKSQEGLDIFFAL